MKKIVFSAGLAAIGAAGIQNAAAAASDVISPKAWNMGATLRGFYDDNYDTLTHSKGSFGVEVSPNISINLPLRQTDFGMRYTYGLYYYQDRQDIGVNAIDQTHQFELWLDHKFNTRWHLNATDAFAVGQEPELLQSGASQPYRINGNNIANHANISLETQWTHMFNTSLHYGNAFYDYDSSGATVNATTLTYTPPTINVVRGNGYQSVTPSLAGLLNRDEQNLGIDFQWVLSKTTTFFVGYNFSLVNYTGNEAIAAYNFLDNGGNPSSLIYHSDSRDSMSHYLYVGLQHQFTANIGGTVRAGANYTDDFNDPLSDSTQVSPYVDLSINYTYVPGSYVQLGLTHDINSTQVASVNQNSGSLTSYQESTVLYASINHKFTPDLIGTIIGRFQNSQYVGGANDNSNEQDYGVGVNLHYQINRYFSTEIGYNYDNFVSSVQTAYERNRVYLGVSATY